MKYIALMLVVALIAVGVLYHFHALKEQEAMRQSLEKRVKEEIEEIHVGQEEKITEKEELDEDKISNSVIFLEEDIFSGYRKDPGKQLTEMAVYPVVADGEPSGQYRIKFINNKSALQTIGLKDQDILVSFNDGKPMNVFSGSLEERILNTLEIIREDTPFTLIWINMFYVKYPPGVDDVTPAGMDISNNRMPVDSFLKIFSTFYKIPYKAPDSLKKAFIPRKMDVNCKSKKHCWALIAGLLQEKGFKWKMENDVITIYETSNK